MLNTIKLSLEKVTRETVIDGLVFSNIVYLIVNVDGEDLLKKQFFEGSFLFYDELRASASKSGEYLIFTSVTGIADAGGWDYVKVVHHTSHIEWKLKRDQSNISYMFEGMQYVKEIEDLAKKLDNCKGIPLEPSNVTFPEIRGKL